MPLLIRNRNSLNGYTTIQNLAIAYDTQPVWVYKSNIATDAARQVAISAILQLEGVSKCTVDIDDCDKVLRVVGTVCKDQLLETLARLGFTIDEL